MEDYSVSRLSEKPDLRNICIAWAAQEWGQSSGYDTSDWQSELDGVLGQSGAEIFIVSHNE
jgi:hypothetical protein